MVIKGAHNHPSYSTIETSLFTLENLLNKTHHSPNPNINYSMLQIQQVYDFIHYYLRLAFNKNLTESLIIKTLLMLITIYKLYASQYNPNQLLIQEDLNLTKGFTFSKSVQIQNLAWWFLSINLDYCFYEAQIFDINHLDASFFLS